MVDNVEMPMFGCANPGKAPSWNDVDHFDVDVLAEYLLEDGGLMSGSGITFDFA